MNTALRAFLSIISAILGIYTALTITTLPSGSLGAILLAIAALGFFSVTAYTVYVESGKPE